MRRKKCKEPKYFHIGYHKFMKSAKVKKTNIYHGAEAIVPKTTSDTINKTIFC